PSRMRRPAPPGRAPGWPDHSCRPPLRLVARPGALGPGALEHGELRGWPDLGVDRTDRRELGAAAAPLAYVGGPVGGLLPGSTRPGDRGAGANRAQDLGSAGCTPRWA